MFDVKTALVACLLAMSACDSEPLDEAPGFDDKADTGSWDMIDISVGESLTGLSVEKLQGSVENASQADLQRSIVLLKLHLLAGESATVVMRAESTGVDPYLIVKDMDEGFTLGQNDDQNVVTNLGAWDAMVSVRAAAEQDVLIFASGGADLHTGGQFTVDVIAHSSPNVKFHISSVTSEIHFKNVRDKEVSVRNWVSGGYLLEGEDGFLKRNPDMIDTLALRDRVEVIRAIDPVNEGRLLLIDALIDRSGTEGVTRESVGQAVGAIYRATR